MTRVSGQSLEQAFVLIGLFVVLTATCLSAGLLPAVFRAEKKAAEVIHRLLARMNWWTALSIALNLCCAQQAAAVDR